MSGWEKRRVEEAAKAPNKPWLNPKRHKCAGAAFKQNIFMAPVRQSKTMVVGCGICKRSWPYPESADMYAAWVSGYKAARQHVQDAVDQLAVNVVGLQA